MDAATATPTAHETPAPDEALIHITTLAAGKVNEIREAEAIEEEFYLPFAPDLQTHELAPPCKRPAAKLGRHAVELSLVHDPRQRGRAEVRATDIECEIAQR